MEQINIKNFIPNIQRIEKISEILNINIDQTFQIQFFTHKKPYKNTWYKLTNNGLMYDYRENGNFKYKLNALEGLIVGKHQIIIN